MTWTDKQKQRLAKEKHILDLYFPQSTWHDQKEPSKANVKCPFKTVDGNKYEVTIYVHKEFPSKRPNMYLTYPNPCFLADGKKLTTKQNSHAMHTLSAKDGFTQLCHCKTNSWSSKTTLYQILTKAAMWVQAFDFHVVNNEPLSKYLRNMD